MSRRRHPAVRNLQPSSIQQLPNRKKMGTCVLNYLGGTFVIRPKTSLVFGIFLARLSPADESLVATATVCETPFGLCFSSWLERREQRPGHQNRTINSCKYRYLSTFSFFIAKLMIFKSAFLRLRHQFQLFAGDHSV